MSVCFRESGFSYSNQNIEELQNVTYIGEASLNSVLCYQFLRCHEQLRHGRLTTV